MASNRETTRDALVALLETALVGTGLPAKTVSGSFEASLEGITPLVMVLGTGTIRTPSVGMGRATSFLYEVSVWVLQSDIGWTVAQAEDALDEIESIIAGVYEDNVNTSDWELIEYASPTSAITVNVAGVPYYMETISTRVDLAKS